MNLNLNKQLVLLIVFLFAQLRSSCAASAEVLGCGGFVKSFVTIDYSRVSLKLLTTGGSLKYTSDCAPNNGYYFVPIYDKGSYILKIESPNGWHFEPQQVSLNIDGSEEDPCSSNKDVNFMFKGFSINGRVLSNGLNNGPEGIELTLIAKANNNVMQKTSTVKDGHFIFKDILPGTYEIRASQAKIKFLNKTPIIVTISDDSLTKQSPETTLTISGYTVSGRVVSDGEPVAGVRFGLFGEKNKFLSQMICDKNLPVIEKQAKLTKLNYLCSVFSNDAGKFVYENLVPGKYSISSYYKGKNIEFKVLPEMIDVEVGHKDLEIEKVFQIEGFSVSGRVLASHNGVGIADAQVLLTNGNGLSGNIINTKSDGFYLLENIKTGTYTLQVTANHVLFESMSVRVSPSSPNIPDIVASAFEVCGKIVFTLKPIDLKIVFEKMDASNENGKHIVEMEANGDYCAFIKPAKYRVSLLTNFQSDGQVIFAPSKQIINVIDKPILNLDFKQFTAKISGKIVHLDIKNLNELNDISIELRNFGKVDLLKSWSVREHGIKYEFDSLLPGQYHLSVNKLDNQWCWKNMNINFEIKDENIENLDFLQTGFKVMFITSHSVKLSLKLETGNEEIVEIKEPNKTIHHCVTKRGKYHIKLDSCHRFNDKQNSFVINIDSDLRKPIIYNAIKHRVNALIKSKQTIEKFSLTWKMNSIEMDKNDISITTKNTSTGLEYKIEAFIDSFKEITIEPKSSKFIFKPKTFQVDIENNCIENAVTFEAREGLFIKGAVSPAVEAVKVKIISMKTDEELIVETDKSGKYVAGPFENDFEDLEISAERTGFIFQPSWTKKDAKNFGYFKSEKLASIIVNVYRQDKNQLEALSDVLISLSGGIDNFRQNSITSEKGELIFNGISPGQYFLRAVLKEYKFEPNSKILEIKQGETIEVKIIGKRVAFSCFGLTNSLNGDAEGNLIMEAVGHLDEAKKCSEIQEEAVTDVNGNFRIRGLEPGCTYVIRLKSAAENNHVSRTMPSEETITLPATMNEDITGLRFIILHKQHHMEITGIVMTEQEYLPNLRLKLFSESDPDIPVYVTSLSSSFFSLSSVPMDNRNYIVQLEVNNLNTDFEPFSKIITANKTYEHLHFLFEAKQAAQFSQFDHQHSVDLFHTLFIAGLISLVLFNTKIVINIFLSIWKGNCFTSVWSYLHDNKKIRNKRNLK